MSPSKSVTVDPGPCKHVGSPVNDEPKLYDQDALPDDEITRALITDPSAHPPKGES